MSYIDPNSVNENLGQYSTHLLGPLTKGTDGELCDLQGRPTGLRVGHGGSVERSPFPPPSPIFPEVVLPGGVPVPGGHAAPEPAALSHGPSLAALPIYLWMLLLGVVAGIVTSGSPFVIPSGGLHMHPVYGVAAAVAVVGLYRYLMTWFPTALAVTLASTCVWAVNVWAWRHAAQLRDLPTQRSEALLYLTTLVERFQRSTLVTPDPWVIGAVVAGLGMHFVYWRHRREVAAVHGWMFNRGAGNAARVMLTLAATSTAIGLLLSWLR